ncbi:MAG: hypothetical protein M3539_10485 [Acidobacteriota bacterium]|nr:hypothetical protein [Acidobacteriota bacterium]
MMKKVDMSAQAIAARLKRTSQLRRLCLSLAKTKLQPPEKKTDNRSPSVEKSDSVMRKSR